jgi:N-glycosylase/DNA lyase
MTVAQFPLPAINNAIREVCVALKEECHRPPSCWTSMSEDDLWRELVACILGSRVRFEVAHSAVERMERRRLFCERRRSSRFREYEEDVKEALSETASGESHRYPFFRARASQIRRAAERLYEGGDTVRSFLQASRDIRDARRRLNREVPGLGPKQASLFLRNVGYSVHVAVLDIHVLTYMNWVGLTETLRTSIPTVRKYEALEDAFIEHAHSLGCTPDRFDLAVWVVVRVAKEEGRTWG